MDKEKIHKISLALPIILGSIWLLLIAGYHVYIVLSRFAHPVISPNYILIVMCVLAPPTVLLVFIKKRSKVAKISKALIVFTVAATILSLVIVTLLTLVFPYAGVCSVTEDTKDYLKFGANNNKIFSEYRRLLPETIPPAADDIEYKYYYNDYVFDGGYYVFAAWTLPTEDYKSEKLRIEAIADEFNLSYVSDNGMTVFTDEPKLKNLAYNYFVRVSFDDELKKIKYTVCCISSVSEEEVKEIT